MGNNKRRKDRADAQGDAGSSTTQPISQPQLPAKSQREVGEDAGKDAGSSTAQPMSQPQLPLKAQGDVGEDVGDDAGSSTPQTISQSQPSPDPKLETREEVGEDAGSSSILKILGSSPKSKLGTPKDAQEDAHIAWVALTRELELLRAEKSDHASKTSQLKEENETINNELSSWRSLTSYLQQRIITAEKEMEEHRKNIRRLEETAAEQSDKLITSGGERLRSIHEMENLRRLNQSMASNIVELRNEVARKDAWLATATRAQDEEMAHQMRNSMLESANAELKKNLQEAQDALADVATQQQEMQQELFETDGDTLPAGEDINSPIHEELLLLTGEVPNVYVDAGVQTQETANGADIGTQTEMAAFGTAKATQTEGATLETDSKGNQVDEEAAPETEKRGTQTDEGAAPETDTDTKGTQTEVAEGDAPHTDTTGRRTIPTAFVFILVLLMLVIGGWMRWNAHKERNFWLRANLQTGRHLADLLEERWASPLWVEQMNFSAENWLQVIKKPVH